MQKFEGKVAVVTGAASGIGLGMAEVLAGQGMKVVMADIEEAPLREAADILQKANFDVLPVRTDVSDFASVVALAAEAISHFEKVHVLCNNAGVAGGGAGAIWQSTANDWQWVMGVNLMGVVHGLRAFVPSMIEHGEAGHIVNTSSILGLTTGAGSIYGVSKHAVTRLTEGLYHDLRNANSVIGASLLCPGMIATNIIKSRRNRPVELTDDVSGADSKLIDDRMEMVDLRFKEQGMPARQVGEIVLDAISNDRFYVLTHQNLMARVEQRMSDMVNFRNPTPPRPFAESQ